MGERMSAHTPGRWWHRSGTGPYLHEVVGRSPRGKEIVLARVAGRDPERTGNAHIFAAALDLRDELSHLVRLLEPLEQAGTLNVPGLATLNGARAALAKARGES